MKRFLAIAVIWLGCAVAWLILGSTLHLRTDSLSGSLLEEVYALWGPPGRQAPPHGAIATLFFVMQITGRNSWRADAPRPLS